MLYFLLVSLIRKGAEDLGGLRPLACPLVACSQRTERGKDNGKPRYCSPNRNSCSARLDESAEEAQPAFRHSSGLQASKPRLGRRLKQQPFCGKTGGAREDRAHHE